jgi:hypothetical protein
VTAPFVWGIRARPEVINVGTVDGRVLSLRVEVPEVWDVVRIAAPPGETVSAVKRAALESVLPGADEGAYVMKLRGFEVLDEGQTLTEAGAVDGSIFLLTHRRRRPVR